MLLQRVLVGYKDLHKIVWPNPHDEADRLILYRIYDIKLTKQVILGQNVPNLSHLPENIHKQFCARPAEKQDALFCCSVNFPRWRYVFERLPPAVTDKIATISEENSGGGDTFSSAVYYRFSPPSRPVRPPWIPVHRLLRLSGPTLGN